MSESARARPGVLTSLSLLALAAALGCGGRAERTSSTSAGGSAGVTAGTGGSTAGISGEGGALSADGTLVIPVEPRDTASVSLMLSETDVDIVSMPGSSVSLALGEEYPKVVRFDLGDSYIVRPNSTFVRARDGLALMSVDAPGDGIDARWVDARTFEVGIREVGDFAVLLEGRWYPQDENDPPELPFVVSLGVRVRRVASVAWRACSDSVYVASGGGFRSSSLTVYGEDGVAFTPANARATRGATVSVHAEPGTHLSAVGGIDTLLATGPAQTIEVRSDFGSLGTFELVPLENIDGLMTRFMMFASWTRGGRELMSGASIDTSLGPNSLAYIEVEPTLTVGSARLCSPALGEWFELRSTTPSTCPIAEEPWCTDCLSGILPVAANVVGIGACNLTLSGAAFNAQMGLESTLAVDFIE